MAWKNLEKGILILEEEGNWIIKEEDVKTRIEMRQPKLEIVKETISDSTLAQSEETKVRTHTITQSEDSSQESQEVSQSSQEVRKARKSEKTSTEVRKSQEEGLTIPEFGGGNEDRRKRDREGEEECWVVGSVAGRGVVELADLKPISIQNHDNLKTGEKAKDTGLL